MLHLNDETLARLVDERPSAEEALHLETCELCRGELAAFRGQTRALGALPDLAAPVHVWRDLEGRLRETGLVAAEGRRWGVRVGGLRVAAGIALFILGMATGRLVSAGAPAVESGAELWSAGLRGEPAPAVAAEQRLKEAEAAYFAALAAYSELSGSADAIDPLNRLAALEGIVLTTRAALAEAPADPLINGYHLSALGEREAILRQIDSTHPGESWY